MFIDVSAHFDSLKTGRFGPFLEGLGRKNLPTIYPVKRRTYMHKHDKIFSAVCGFLACSMVAVIVFVLPKDEQGYLQNESDLALPMMFCLVFLAGCVGPWVGNAITPPGEEG